MMKTRQSISFIFFPITCVINSILHNHSYNTCISISLHSKQQYHVNMHKVWSNCCQWKQNKTGINNGFPQLLHHWELCKVVKSAVYKC